MPFERFQKIALTHHNLSVPVSVEGEAGTGFETGNASAYVCMGWNYLWDPLGSLWIPGKVVHLYKAATPSQFDWEQGPYLDSPKKYRSAFLATPPSSQQSFQLTASSTQHKLANFGPAESPHPCSQSTSFASWVGRLFTIELVAHSGASCCEKRQAREGRRLFRWTSRNV